jgi:hypothetical protein
LVLANNNTPECVVRLLICVPLLLVACSAGGDDEGSESLIQVSGKLENKNLNEASGLARSNRTVDLYWAVNDDGPAAIHALDSKGRNLGLVHIDGAENRDWEDIASFTLDDTAYLLVADFGDNDSKRKRVSLYVVEEPDPDSDSIDVAWQIDYNYPGGPRDAESLAVDAADRHVYVLSKRTVPAELYRLPLDPTQEDVTTAAPVDVVDSLPQPSKRELRNAMSSGWGWQPTAMDFAPDGSSAIILTYDGVNYFQRGPGQTWPEALQGQAMHLALGKFKNAESITYSSDGTAAIVTVEKKHAPILRIKLEL